MERDDREAVGVMKVKLKLSGWLGDMAHLLYQLLFHCVHGRHDWVMLEPYTYHALVPGVSKVARAGGEMTIRQFPCTQCGACCKLVWANKYFIDRDMVKDDGSCVNLQPDNSCGIYSTRPEVCNFNAIYEHAGLIQLVPIEIFHDHTISGTCQHAIYSTNTDRSKIPERHYRIGSMEAEVGKYMDSCGSDYKPGFYKKKGESK